MVRVMLDDDELQRIYQWVDEIPLSRPKRSIARDFADGVLVAEIVCHYFPKLIELHNYSNANGYAQKIYNWCVATGGRARAEGAGCTWPNPPSFPVCRRSTLNQKVFKKLGFQLQKEEMDGLCNCQTQAVERLLKTLQMKMAKCARAHTARGCGKHVPTPPPPPCLPGTARSVLRPVMRRANRGRSTRRRRRARSPRPRGDQRQAGRRPQRPQTVRCASCSPRRT